MEEPIPSYYFKHGTSGLSGVYVMGIKEQPSLTVSLPDTGLIGTGRSVAQAQSIQRFRYETPPTHIWRITRARVGFRGAAVEGKRRRACHSVAQPLPPRKIVVKRRDIEIVDWPCFQSPRFLRCQSPQIVKIKRVTLQ